MTDRIPMTVEGKAKLEEELKHLRNVERPKVIQAIDEARGHGDLSENAEYSAAKEKQAFIEGRIQDINNKLALAQVIDPKTVQGSKIVFGATVEVEDEDGNEKTYKIVGEDEADLKNCRLSVYSPLAKALLGKEEGDEAIVQAPKGRITYQILSVRFE